MIWLIKQQFCCYITFFLFVSILLFHVFIIHTFVGKKSKQKHQESQSSLNFLKYFPVSTPSSARIFMMLFFSCSFIVFSILADSTCHLSKIFRAFFYVSFKSKCDSQINKCLDISDKILYFVFIFCFVLFYCTIQSHFSHRQKVWHSPFQIHEHGQVHMYRRVYI